MISLVALALTGLGADLSHPGVQSVLGIYRGFLDRVKAAGIDPGTLTLNGAGSHTLASLEAHPQGEHVAYDGSPKAEEALFVAAYLASDAACWHTGDTIVIDGGALIQM